MEKQEPHKHDFNKLGFIREVGTTDDRVINRIILGRRCSCEKFQAFEMGEKHEMRELYRKLSEGKKHESEDTAERPDTVRADNSRMG